MNRREDTGSRAFFWISMTILGGLLFAAGVMVGRQMSPGGAGEQAVSLEQIDARDSSTVVVDGGQLDFHDVLGKAQPPPELAVEAPDAAAGQPPEKAEDDKIAAPERPDDSKKPDAASADEKPAEGEAEGAHSARYSLQVAAYREMEPANQLVEKLLGYGYEQVRVIKSDVPGKGVYFRVRLGRFATKEQAEKIKEKLAVGQAMDSLVVLAE